MSLYCAVCTEGLLQEQELENICVGDCGHTFHYSCLNLNATGKIPCPVKPCQVKIMADTVFQLFPILWPFPTSQASGSNDDLQNNYRLMMCSICNDPMTDLKNISVATECGHIFHNNCLLRWIGLKSKQFKCAVISCNENLTKTGIMPIRPSALLCSVGTQQKKRKIPLVDKVKKDQPIHKEAVKIDEPAWETVFKMIKDKFKNPNVNISEDEAIDLKKKIAKLNTAEKWKTLPFDDNPMKICLKATNDKNLLQLPQCKKCEKKETKITNLKQRITSSKQQKARYQRENEYLKEQKKMAMTEGILSIAYLREANAQKILEIEELRKNNEAHQQKIQTLQSEVATTGADLSQANGQISELNKLKQNIEETEQTYKQEIQTLQSQVITAREDNFRGVAELREMRSRNDELTEQNESMKRDLSQLQEVFSNQYSAFTDFLISELQTKFYYETLVENMFGEINNLNESNNNLRTLNEELMKNNYRCPGAENPDV